MGVDTATGPELVIDSQEAHDLAVRLAQLTGESLEQAVVRALRESVAAEQARRVALGEEEIASRMRAIRHIREQGRTFRERGLSSDHAWLYDEDGLPI